MTDISPPNSLLNLFFMDVWFVLLYVLFEPALE